MKKFICMAIISMFLIIQVSNSEAFVLEVAKKWDGVAIPIDTDWFALDLGPSTNSQRKAISINFDRPVKHTFQFSCPSATVVNLQLKFNAITKVHIFNSNVAIGANEIFHFSVTLHKDMTYNVQHKTGTQNCAVVIIESPHVDL